MYIYIGACSSVMKKNNFLVSCQVIFTRGLSFLLIHWKLAGNLILLSLLKPRVPWDQRDAIHIMAVWPMGPMVYGCLWVVPPYPSDSNSLWMIPSRNAMTIHIKESWNPTGSVSKPCTPVVHIKIAGKWMFIPLKMVLIGIDPYPTHLTQVVFRKAPCRFGSKNRTWPSGSIDVQRPGSAILALADTLLIVCEFGTSMRIRSDFGSFILDKKVKPMFQQVCWGQDPIYHRPILEI